MNTSQLIEDYRRDGVVRCRSLLSSAELGELRQEIIRYQQEVLTTLPDADYTLEADGATVRNFWRMEQHDPFFQSLGKRPKLLQVVSPLVNGEPVLVGVETFNKPARVGSAVPAHQDNAYFCQSPPDVLTVWISIDPATVENGAVEYLLGSHHNLRPHAPSGVKGNSFGLAGPPEPHEFKAFLGTVEPGDALIHHCQTIHQSRPNLSDRSRMSLILVYRGRHTCTNENLREEYRRALALTPQNA